MRKWAWLTQQVVGGSTRKANLLGAIAVAIMMVVITVDVVLRNVFSQPIPGTSNLAEYLMVVVVFFGLAETQARGGHIRVDILFSRFPDRLRAIYSVLLLLVALGTFALITWQGMVMAWDAWQIRQVSHGIPRWPIYPVKFVVPVGGFLMCLQLVVDIAHEAGKLRARLRIAKSSPTSERVRAMRSRSPVASFTERTFGKSSARMARSSGASAVPLRPGMT